MDDAQELGSGQVDVFPASVREVHTMNASLVNNDGMLGVSRVVVLYEPRKVITNELEIETANEQKNIIRGSVEQTVASINLEQ
tara:strand:+ start:149 stop:397 length:249 start_codon:yes stop_codon:yes gene_type:complete